MPVRTISRYPASSSRSSSRRVSWGERERHPPPGVRDDAVGAEVDAAVLNLQHGPSAALQAAGGQNLKGAAVEGVVQGGDGLALLPGALQQSGEAQPVPGAGHQIHPQAVHGVRVGLGIAAAHSDDSVRAGLAGPAVICRDFLSLTAVTVQVLII